MATMHLTPLGVAIDLSHSEVTQIISFMNSGASGAGALTALLTQLVHLGITGTTGASATATAISGAATVMLNRGAAYLNRCNSKRTGIHLFGYWFGRFWCRPQ
jgi:hypothetical protein